MYVSEVSDYKGLDKEGSDKKRIKTYPLPHTE